MAGELLGYGIEEHRFNDLRTLNKRLFGDGTSLSEDHRRDIANLMHVILDEVESIPLHRDEAEKLVGTDHKALKVVWTALQQFLDNQDECAEEPSEEAQIAQKMVDRFDAYFAKLGG